MADRPKFDILRGWPNGGAVEKTFVPASGVELVEGDFVEMLSDGTVDKVTLASGDDKAVFCVIEGNKEADSYSGHYLNKAVCITGDYEVITENFAAGAYEPGLPVTAIGGQFALVAAGEPTVGHVSAYDSSANTLTVVVTA
jgi:hypothetical protein